MKKMSSVVRKTLIGILMMLAVPAYGQSIQVLTEEFPPYNYQENGKIKGVSTEVVKAVLKEMKISSDIHIKPWKRILKETRNHKNTLVYSIGRNKKREKNYKWVGIIAPADFYFFALKDRTDIVINNLEDAKKYKIGTVREDLREQYLVSKGFVKGKEIFSTTSYESNLKKLARKRIDLWTMPELVAYYYLEKNKQMKGKVKKVFHLSEISSEGYYMAFGNKTSDKVVEKFRAALERIKKNGTYDKILKKYLH